MTEKEQIKKIIEISSETIERSLLAKMGNENAISLSAIRLDNDFQIAEFKNNENIKWISEEEKEDAFDEGLVWSVYVGAENMHASSIQAIMLYINNL